jgi:tetratricopeptide (TPR) repeat protein
VADRRRSRPPAVWGNIPPRNPHFTGRIDLLDELHARLGDGLTAVLPEALHGMGGVGKSHLAIEYAHRFSRDYDIVWWIPAGHAAQIVTSLVELSRRLALPVPPEAANVAVPAVLDALRLGEPYAHWLLVFDNAEDPRTVQPFLPPSDTGRILVTSRNPNWSSVAHPVAVDVFDRPESVHLLRRRASELADAEADRLAEALGDLPLALEQAGTWLAETGMAAGEYLRLFAEKHAELLSTAPPVGYELPVQAAWNVSLDRLAETNPTALRLLQVCAFFASEPISRQIFRRGRQVSILPELDAALRDPIRLGEAIRQLSRYALARIDHHTGAIQLHRLVQSVLRDRMTADERTVLRHGAHALLAASDPGEPDNPKTWPTYAELYPHLVAAEAAESADPWLHDLLVNEVIYLYRWGDHQRSLELADHVHSVWARTVREDAPDMLRLAGWHGWVSFILGRYADAARINTRVLALTTQIHGNDHPETLLAMGNVSVDRIVAGDFTGALELAEDRMRRAERAFGEGDAHALAAAVDVGVGLRLVGRYREARDLDERTWHRRVELLGEYHLDTLRALTHATLDQRDLGDYLGAVVRHEEIVGLVLQAVGGGADHFQVLLARTLLAVALRKAGRHAEALDLAAEVESRLERRYGHDHPRTIAASLALSVDRRHAGELAEAAELCESTLGHYRRAFGEHHPYTAAAAVNLAIILRQAGRPDRALDLDTSTVAALTRRLGADHPWTLVAATNLASDRYALGDFTLAHTEDTDTYARSLRVLGADHPSTLVLGGNLALDLRAAGRAEEADDLRARTVDGLGRVLGVDHPATRATVGGSRADCDIDPVPM